MAAMGFFELLGLLPFLFGFGGGVPISLPPLPPDPAVEAAAPESALYYVSWTGVADAKSESANHTEQFLAEPEIRELAAYAESAIVKAIQQATANDPQASAAAMEGVSVAKTLYLHPTAIYLGSVEPKAPDAQGPRVNIRGGLVVNAGERAKELEKSLLALTAMLPQARGDASSPDASSKGKAPPVKGKAPAGKGKSVAKRAAGSAGASSDVTIGGVAFRRLSLPPDAPHILWGFKDSLLIVVIGGEPEAQALVDRLNQKGAAPAWLQKLYADAPVERRATASYINIRGILEAVLAAVPNPQVSGLLEQLGVNRMVSVGAVTGLEKEGMISRSVLSFDGEMPELFSALVGSPLTLEDLRTIPADANLALVARANLATIYRQTITTASRIHPDAGAMVEQVLQPIEGQLGLRLVDDVLEPLGDVWRIYNSPGQGGSLLTGAALEVDVSDAERFKRTLDRLLEATAPAIDNAGATIRTFSYGVHEVSYLQATRAEFPLPVAWCVSDKRLLIALNPQMIKARLSAPADERSFADLPAVHAAFAGGGPSALSYFDVESFLPAVYSLIEFGASYAAAELAKSGIELDLSKLPSYASLSRHARPATATVRRMESSLIFEHRQTLPVGNGEITSSAPVMISLLLPARQKAREAMRRTQAADKLKQIGLYLYNYEDVHRSFPVVKSNAKAFDKDGKPLLSWRVHLLRYMEEEALYNEFHLDEPWDSPHNRQLISRMPDVYAPTSHPELAAEGKTTILMPTGERTVGAHNYGMELADITDSPSITILLVEAAPEAAVIWTRPDDLSVDPSDPFAGLRGARQCGFNVLFADIGVRMLPLSIDPEILRMLFDPADGKAMPADLFEQ